MKRVIISLLVILFLGAAVHWIVVPLYRRWRHCRAMTKISHGGGYVATNWTEGLVVGFYPKTDPGPVLPFSTDLAGVRTPAPFGMGRLPEELKHLNNADGVRILNLTGTRITDQQLEILKQLPELRSLILSDTSISDTGLQYVADCQQLLNLDLAATHITSAGVTNLVRLVELRELSLWGTDIDDSIAPSINHLTQLLSLQVDNSFFDRAGYGALVKAQNGGLLVRGWEHPRRRPIPTQ